MGGACSSPDLGSPECEAEQLPPPRDVPWIWVQHVTPDMVLVFSPDGQPYYHNIRTQESTWPRKPEELKMAHAIQVRWMNEQAASMIGSSRAAAGRGDSVRLVPSPETIEQQRRENEAKLDRQLEAALESLLMRQCAGGQEAKGPSPKRPADGPSPGRLLDNEIEVTVPDGAREGERLAIYHLGLKFSVLVPLGCAGGSVLRVSLFLELRQAEGHGGVRMFEEPLPGAAPLDTVPCGERTPCTARSGEFMRVNVGQLDGWVGRKNVVPLPGVVVHAKVPPTAPQPALPAADAPPPPPTDTDPELPSSWRSEQEAADRAGLGRTSSRAVHEAVPLPRSCKSETSIPTSVGSTACEVPMRHTYPESELSGLCSPPQTPGSKRSKADLAFSSGA